MTETDLVAWATRIATEAHCTTGAVRYDVRGNLPYIVHSLRVALLVGANGGSPAAIAAAILHDVLEDTPVTAVGWPDDVRELVEACTKCKGEDRLAAVRRLTDSPREAILVKLADRYDNGTAESNGATYLARSDVRPSTIALLEIARQRGYGDNDLVRAVAQLDRELISKPIKSSP